MKKNLFITAIISLFFAITPLFAKEIIEYKGSDMGGALPQWVLDAENRNTKKLPKSLGLGKNTKIWVFYAEGQNLDYLKEWCDLADFESEIIASSGTNGTDSAVVSVNGLEKTADYWIKAKDDGNNELYTYYVVYTMPLKLWKKQVKGKVSDLGEPQVIKLNH